MSIAALIRNMYDRGEITNSPEDKKMVAAKYGITVQTVHATIKKHLAKKGLTPNVVRRKARAVVFDSNEHYDLVKDAVRNRFNKCYEQARAKGYDLCVIPIDWSLKGCVAGQFCWRGMFDRKFRVNMVLAKENLDDYIENTVPHEFAHYIVNEKYRNGSVYHRPKPHGREWKSIMRIVFGLVPTRCHDYDVTNARQRKSKRYNYRCGCRVHAVSSILHKRMQRGQRRYCRLCKQMIDKSTYVGPAS